MFVLLPECQFVAGFEVNRRLRAEVIRFWPGSQLQLSMCQESGERPGSGRIDDDELQIRCNGEQSRALNSMPCRSLPTRTVVVAAASASVSQLVQQEDMTGTNACDAIHQRVRAGCSRKP
jgi:hypothetical protein